MKISVASEIERIYKADSHRVLATLMRILGDLDQAEEALQEAFSAALRQWPTEGLPQNPFAWLISAGKFKAIDAARRSAKEREILTQQTQAQKVYEPRETYLVEDDRLRLIFYCCHPQVPVDSRIALALRDVCGLSTEDIARLYLVPGETIKKRISRAKAQIKELDIPYEIPAASDLAERLASVLQVIYLIFTEGYAPLRPELTAEAIFLGRHLVGLLPTPQSLGLMALLLIQESRNDARISRTGEIIPLEKQDRSLWKRDLIDEGLQLLHRAVLSGRLGSYGIQAAIASVHAAADSVESTEWNLIVDYYDMLLSIQPSPVIELHKAIAVGMHEGPEAGLLQIEKLAAAESLKSYHFLFAAKAEFYKKLGRTAEAILAYRSALALVRHEPERRYLESCLAAIS